MNTTPPPMPEPLCIDDHEARFSKAQIEARDTQWMERITALEAQKQELRELLSRGLWFVYFEPKELPDQKWIDDARTALENTND